MGYFIYHNRTFRPNFFSPKFFDSLKHIFNHLNPFKKIIVAGTAHPGKFETNHYEIPKAHYNLTFEESNEQNVIPANYDIIVQHILDFAKKRAFRGAHSGALC